MPDVANSQVGEEFIELKVSLDNLVLRDLVTQRRNILQILIVVDLKLQDELQKIQGDPLIIQKKKRVALQGQASQLQLTINNFRAFADSVRSILSHPISNQMQLDTLKRELLVLFQILKRQNPLLSGVHENTNVGADQVTLLPRVTDSCSVESARFETIDRKVRDLTPTNRKATIIFVGEQLRLSQNVLGTIIKELYRYKYISKGQAAELQLQVNSFGEIRRILERSDISKEVILKKLKVGSEVIREIEAKCR